MFRLFTRIVQNAALSENKDKQLSFIILQTKNSEMAEKPQRSLRPRRPFPYLPPDTEDPDNFISARPYSHRDALSPAMELNYSAKILTKFIQSANKSLQDSIKKNQLQSKPKASFQVEVGERSRSKIQVKDQKQLKTNPGKKEDEKVQKPIEKESYNIKEKINQSEKSKNLVENAGVEKTKSNPQKQLYLNPDLVNFYAKIKKTNPNISNDEILPKLRNYFQGNRLNDPEAASKALLQQQLYFQQKYFQQNPLVDERQLQTSLPSSNEQAINKTNKLFGRAAYHVAIAYHIHLRAIKDKGQYFTNSFSIDPTYNARKLKGEQIPSHSG